eukprot:3641065-Rhodomonas_salina.1
MESLEAAQGSKKEAAKVQSVLGSLDMSALDVVRCLRYLVRSWSLRAYSVGSGRFNVTYGATRRKKSAARSRQTAA